MRYVEEFKKLHVRHARTLNPEEVFGPRHKGESGEYQFTHKDGWTIKGSIIKDWYFWVNDFEAKHPILGWVQGNFETCVEARSRKAYEDFVSKHPPNEWDYSDI